MKKTSFLDILAAAVLISGCASHKSETTLNTVQPSPQHVATAHAGDGILMVYSANKVNADFNNQDQLRREYSDYTIYDADGKLFRRVRNNVGIDLGNPAPIELATGEYRVVARQNGSGYVTVPVVIAANQNTTVHLDENQ